MMDNILTNIIEQNNANIGTDDTDYVGEGGLMYCGKCHTAKQIRVVMGGKELMPYTLCDCQKQKRDSEEQERKAREHQMMIDRNRAACFPDKELVTWRFETADNDSKALLSVKKYAENFPRMFEDGCGIMLYGGVGTGKTFAAACAANAIIDMGFTVHMTDFSRIINTLWGMKEGRQEYLDSLNSYALLVIDDLAAERDTDYANEIVMNVIDSRCKSGKPVIITTNLTAEELFKNSDIRKRRVYSRLFEMCIPIQYTGQDRRMKKMAENIKTYKDMLGI